MKAIITMGIPAAGKSTVVNKKYDAKEWAFIDPDEIKKEHPKYDAKNPQLVHDWSKAIAKARMHEAIAVEKNIIVDGTGTNSEKLVSWVNEFHSVGYEVTLLFVKCNLQTALKRNAARDRIVPEEVIRKKSALISISFEIVSSYVDDVVIINNN